MKDRPTFASVILNRGFRFLWLNQILVQLAYNTLNFTLIVWVFKLTESALAVSFLVMAMYLPAVLFGIFAGVFVDITDRRKVIIVIDFLLALSFLLFILIKGSYSLILLNTFFINSLAQFFVPAEGSSIPMLVNKKQLIIANSLFSLTLYGSFMIGFSLAGPLLNFFGINYVFYLAFGAMFLAFISAQFLPTIKVANIHAKYNNLLSFRNIRKIVNITFKEATETWQFIRGNLAVAVAIGLLSAIQGIIGSLAVVMPSFMEKVLRIHATDTSYFVMVPLGLGMVVGALIIGKWAHNNPRRSVVIPSIVAAGVIFILAGLIPSIAEILQASDLSSKIPHPRYFFRVPTLSATYAIGAFLLGLVAVGIIIPSQTVLQENTNTRNRGKIFAVLAVIMYAISAVPVLLAGLLADLIGPSAIFLGMGVVVFIAGVIALRPNQFFRERYLSDRIRAFLGLGHWQGE